MQDTFTVKNYSEKPTFSSFLPGIAGERGIPVWCYYNNRGQAVCSFGIRDKDHAVMEFCAAHTAYQNVQRTGFRTFIRHDGRVTEAFRGGSADMEIRPNELALHWRDDGFAVDVVYFVLPGCRLGALARQVTLKNLGEGARISLLDGMPALVPYGVNQDSLKNMPQLSKAWMQVEDAEERLPFYRVRASMGDTAVVTKVEGGNFALGCTESGEPLPVAVDPEAVFGYDTALEQPLGFMAEGFGDRLSAQALSNTFPCAFFLREATLGTGESLTVYELYGQAESKTLFRDFARAPRGAEWFAAKRQEANALTERLTAVIGGKTADAAFDAYSRQSYLDNLLRGGEPVRFADGGEQNTFFLYSRKHGDPEREYNYFVMSPEYYSQGNGNFRDVCQNRRCDVLFHPWVGEADIRLFFSLLQADGYNPLIIDRMTFRVKEIDEALAPVDAADREEAKKLLSRDFTPGELAMAAEGWKLNDTDAEAYARRVLAHAEAEPNASFGEGYWTDHWTYSLDLIENYLAVWPEKKEALLFGEADYPWYETRAFVLPYEKRYEEKNGVLRQVRFLDMERKAGVTHKWMRVEHGKGSTAYSTLMEKLILLCAVKYATLDKVGVGIEMEGGKPGWYDALNGLPALWGSSVAESCELKRLLAFTAQALEESAGEVVLYDEMADLLVGLSKLTGDPLIRWKRANLMREDYRERTAEGVAGDQTVLSAHEAAAMLRVLETNVQEGIDRAVRVCGGICPTYLMFPAGMAEPLPLFLEGPMRWLKLGASAEEKRDMAERVRRSGLYDRKLRMYKVNESLQNLTYEAGRTRCFTPGWLENESVWLHMEYKYLLELLRSGLYEEYERAADTALVPFLDPAVYGRSVYENVSFIASSANPNPALHGRGFVARLSGSTVEFLSLWLDMMFGPSPFTVEDGQLTLRFAPMLPARLVPENGEVEAVFLGRCRVRYHTGASGSLIPGRYTVERIAADGAPHAGACLTGDAAKAVRNGEIKEIDVYIKRNE